jgi:non-homologous end joining protein Ku
VGVTYDQKANKWRARITIKHVQTVLGYYVEEEDAARAYAVAKRRIEKTPEQNNLIELFSYITTNEANIDKFFTVRPRYTSDVLVQTIVLLYRVIIIIIIIIYYFILALI